MPARRRLVSGLLLAATVAAWSPAALHRPTLGLQPRRSLSPCAHGGHAHAMPRDGDGEGGISFKLQAPLPALASMYNYMRVQVVRPTLLHAVVLWSTMRRHSVIRKSMKAQEYEEDASRITWLGALVNLALSVFKLFAGIYGRSAAMIADAGHSFSDLISDALTLLALRLSSLPADVDHPYGHGRFESVASLAIGALLVGAGASFGASAVQALRSPAVSAVGGIALWAALASIVSKEVLFRLTASIGQKINSPVLIANAWHHRSDALSSIVALVGIAGSMLGLTFLDPLAGILVGSMVLWMGLRISYEALAQLTDTSDYEVVQEVQEVAVEVSGVNNVDHVRARSMGGSALVDLAIQVHARTRTPRTTTSSPTRCGAAWLQLGARHDTLLPPPPTHISPSPPRPLLRSTPPSPPRARTTSPRRSASGCSRRPSRRLARCSCTSTRRRTTRRARCRPTSTPARAATSRSSAMSPPSSPPSPRSSTRFASVSTTSARGSRWKRMYACA